jgi:hypothetical protein
MFIEISLILPQILYTSFRKVYMARCLIKNLTHTADTGIGGFYGVYLAGKTVFNREYAPPGRVYPLNRLNMP